MEKNCKNEVFISPKFGEIRVLHTDDKIMFVASDVARALGYVIPQKAVSTHCKHCSKMEHWSNKGTKVTFIPESDVYRLVMKSKLPDAEQFQDWVCEEVLPSIRTKGGYMVAHQEETPEQIMARALQIADDTIKRVQRQNTLLTQQIEQNKPKVLFADAVTASEDSILIGELATILNQKGVKIGQNRLFTYLRENGYLCKEGERRNQPTQKALDLGLFQVKKSTINAPNGSIIVSSTTKVTGKGQIYFINKLIPVCYEC